jgi:hypothetical protein
MSAVRDLPARPSLDSLRKQAKKLSRSAAVPLREAQLMIARQYGFAGWPDLTAEVHKRLSRGLEWAAAQAKVAIHDQDHDRLRELLAEYPALVSWREGTQTLLDSTTSYALDCADPERERIYNRPVAAEMLIDAGAVVQSRTWEHVIRTRAAGMLQLLARKHALPGTLPVLAALGDGQAVRDAQESDEPMLIGRALLNACRFNHASIALQVLDRAIALDPALGRRIDRYTPPGRQAFVRFLIEHAEWSVAETGGPETTPWEEYVIRRLKRARDDNDLPAFRRWLEDESWVLQPRFVQVQIGLIEGASFRDNRESFIAALLDADPALLHMTPRPRSSALVYALDYGHAHLLPLLTRIWPLPDDLPHAAGTGNAAAVARWFDASGQPVLGSLAHHHPGSDPNFKAADLGWGPVTTQQVLDIALAWAVLNKHFEVAAFLLEHGADINTNWATHEPASILHEAAIQGNEEAAKFLIDHGADLTIKDYRYESNAEGWARYAAGNQRVADMLAAAAARRNRDNL